MNVVMQRPIEDNADDRSSIPVIDIATKLMIATGEYLQNMKTKGVDVQTGLNSKLISNGIFKH